MGFLRGLGSVNGNADLEVNDGPPSAQTHRGPQGLGLLVGHEPVEQRRVVDNTGHILGGLDLWPRSCRDPFELAGVDFPVGMSSAAWSSRPRRVCASVAAWRASSLRWGARRSAASGDGGQVATKPDTATPRAIGAARRPSRGHPMQLTPDN